MTEHEALGTLLDLVQYARLSGRIKLSKDEAALFHECLKAHDRAMYEEMGIGVQINEVC